VTEAAGSSQQVRRDTASELEELVVRLEKLRAYQDLFDRAPDAYVVTSTSGVILEANAAASALLERPPADLVGEALTAFVAAESRSDFRRELLRVARHASDEFELEVITRSGRRQVAARASAGAQLAQIRWILRDVTARRRVEEEVRMMNAELEDRIAARTRELAQTSERLESVLREMPQGVLIVGGDGKVQMVNRRAEELTGLPAEKLTEFVRDEPWRMFARDGRELEWDERPLPRALATGEPTLDERVHVERADGERFFLDLSATPVHGPDGLHSVIVTFQDVTAQELRERAERNFVTNAAHELQTPIAAITSGIQVLQAGAKDNEADRDRFLEHIEAACARLDRLTRALLVLARAQAGDEEPRGEVVEIAPLLLAVVEALPGAEIDVSCPEDVAVIANRALLEQALVNLGANAAKYSSGRVLLTAVRGEGRVRLEVRDEGDGIDPTERRQVFDRFYRGGSEKDDDGFGLGLAIVAESVRAINGELALESTDAGTGVSITLPAASIVHK
jgi:PAS domain S-box-containing protein